MFVLKEYSCEWKHGAGFIPNPVDLFAQAHCTFETRAFGRVELSFFVMVELALQRQLNHNAFPVFIALLMCLFNNHCHHLEAYNRIWYELPPPPQR
jgi:hypothetical protein